MKKKNAIKSGVMINENGGKKMLLERLRPTSGLKGSVLKWEMSESGIPKFRLDLFRFLRDSIPLLSSCIWTWSRLASAPGKYLITDTRNESEIKQAEGCLEKMMLRIYPYRFQKTAGYDSFLPMLFNTLFTDGAFAGFLILERDASGVSRFVPIETGYIISRENNKGENGLFYSPGEKEFALDGDDFYYFGLDATGESGLGQSILKAIPFVAYIEQQLIDDMRKAMHNAGYHRLHVQITPPEKLSGEADNAYVERVNEYFDDTVSMIKDCRPEENPVTWDNVKIEYVGPRNLTGIGNSWFMNHRTMIEEICAGTNLSPFMLGYSYGTTHNWAQFKYDLVMRQILSVQRQTSRFLEWIGNIELALKGFNCRCRFKFDNSFSYNATDQADIRKSEAETLLKLYDAGLISKEKATDRADELL